MISIETSIFRGLLYNEDFTRKVIPYLEDQYFDGVHKTLFNVYKELFDKYNSVPTLEALAVTLQGKEIGDSDFEEIIEFVDVVSKNKDELPDTQWLVDQTEEYCRDKAIYNAIYSSISILDGSDSKRDKHSIPDLLDDALAVSFDTSIGMSLFDDAERRYDIYTSDDERLDAILQALNILSNGGLKKKALIVALAFTNVGKSSLMCFLASEYVRRGKNVLYISMEMAEEVVYERVEANLYGVTTNDLKKLTREEYLSNVMKLKEKTHGELIVKEYPTSSAHVGHFRHLLKELKQKRKFKPDIIFVDYINICASSRYKSMSGVNSYSYVKAIAEELRGLGVEFDVPVFSATQTNRGSANESNPDLTATSESIGLPQTADFMFAITTDEVLQDNGQQLFHLLKTRWGNKSKIKPQLVNVNFDLMRYSDVEHFDNARQNESNEVKSKIGSVTNRNKKSNSDEIQWD